MDWTAGYSSDVEYTAGFYREQSPAYLNAACILHGYEPVAPTRPFAYCELGFGRGLTINLLAAANPHGQFYAADFNPAFVAGAQQFAADAKLSNLTLLEKSFEELATGAVPDLPQFDFITLHGIYTWVTAENRRHIVDFIARYLKPGGIVYVSYNAMPGWSPALPLQRLLVEHGDLYPNRSDVQVKKASEFIEQMQQLDAAYLSLNTTLKGRLKNLKEGKLQYLVHEYMHHHWQPLYHIDVVRDFASAKLDFVGSADLWPAFQDLYLSPEKQAFLNAIPSAPLRETLKDYFLNTSFRKDVFIRGARKMNAPRQWEWLSQMGLALLIGREEIQQKIKVGVTEITVKQELYGPVFDALAKRPHTLAELSTLPALRGQPIATLVQIAGILVASGTGATYFVNPNLHADAGISMNRVIASQSRLGDEYQALAAPLLGNGITVGYVEQVVYSIISQHPDANNIDPARIVDQVWNGMKSQGRRLAKLGKTIESDAEALAEVSSSVNQVLALRLNIWRNLMLM